MLNSTLKSSVPVQVVFLKQAAWVGSVLLGASLAACRLQVYRLVKLPALFEEQPEDLPASVKGQ